MGGTGGSSVHQFIHAPSETSINRKCDFCVTDQAPHLTDFILRHHARWKSGGWIIKESMSAVRLKIVPFTHSCGRFQTVNEVTERNTATKGWRLDGKIVRLVRN